MKQAKLRKIFLAFNIFICVNIIVILSLLNNVYGESVWSIEKVPQTTAYYEINGAATDGKVVVICCSEGMIKTIDIKTHKVLFDKVVSNADFKSIIYNGKQFVAVQNKKYIAVSTDGVKWLMKKTNVQLSAICFNGKKYVGIVENNVYESTNLENFSLVYHSPVFSGYYYINNAGNKYYSFAYEGMYRDTNVISASDNLNNWQKCSIKSQSNKNNFSGLVSVFEYDNGLCALKSDGEIVSLESSENLNKSLQFSGDNTNIYNASPRIYSVSSKYGILAYNTEEVFFVNLKNVKNIIFKVNNKTNKDSNFNVTYDGKNYIYYNIDYSYGIQYFSSKDGVRWNYNKIKISNITSFAAGNNIFLFLIGNENRLVCFQKNHLTNVNIKFPTDFGTKESVRLGNILYTNNKFNLTVNSNNCEALYESNDCINWTLKAKFKSIVGNIIYSDGKVIIWSGGYASRYTKNIIDSYEKCQFTSTNSGLHPYNLLGVGIFKNKLTCVYYDYADKGKMYLIFYQSDDGMNWREESLINIYDQNELYSGNTILRSAIFTPSNIFLGASGASCNKIYETNDLKTAICINDPSMYINGGILKKDGSVLLAASHSLINFKNSEAEISNASDSNNISDNDIVKFEQTIAPQNEAGCPYDIEINESTKDTFAINKDTKASIILGKNCDILKYCNGALYYFDNDNKEIKYIKNGTIKVIETFNDLPGAVIVLGDKIYYLKDNNFNSIELENTKKCIEINQDQLGTSNSSSNGIVYMNKDKIIYASEGSYYVNKSGVSKKLFEQSTSLPTYFTNSLDRACIYQNNNSYYYNNSNGNFIYNSMLYIAGDDGLYCYDSKNDTCCCETTKIAANKTSKVAAKTY